MRFFLVGSDPGSDTLRLITDTVFQSRRDALAYLSSDSAAPTLAGLDEEVFVVDLDVATPVLLVEHKTSAEAATAGADTAVAEAPFEAPGDETAEDEDERLAGALRRATGTLESEGIVAPESIGPERAADAGYPTPFVPEPAAWPWDASSEAPDAEGQDETASEMPAAEIPVAEEADEVAPAAEAEEPELYAVPDLPDEEDAAAESEPEPEQAPVPALSPGVAEVEPYALDALEEPSVDDAGFVPAADEPFLGRPVVMGEYDVPEQPVEPMGANGTTYVDVAVDGEEDAAPEPMAEPAVDVTDELPPAAEMAPPAVEEVIGEVVAEDLSEAVPAEEAAYTCDDCVYVNTCPKHHESDPTACGSFQWKIA